MPYTPDLAVADPQQVDDKAVEPVHDHKEEVGFKTRGLKVLHAVPSGDDRDQHDEDHKAETAWLCSPLKNAFKMQNRRSVQLLPHFDPHLVPLRIVVGVGVQVEADDFETVLFIKRDGVFIARLRL